MGPNQVTWKVCTSVSLFLRNSLHCYRNLGPRLGSLKSVHQTLLMGRMVVDKYPANPRMSLARH